MHRTDEITQCRNVFAVKPDYMRLIPSTHMVKGEHEWASTYMLWQTRPPKSINQCNKYNYSKSEICPFSATLITIYSYRYVLF